MSEPKATAGTKVYLSDQVPATNDLAGFSALNYTQIKGVRVAGEIGNNWQTRDNAPIEHEFVNRVKTNLMFSPIQLEVITIVGDPGQAMLQEASGLDKTYSLKIDRADGGKRYLVVQVVSFNEAQGGSDKKIFDAVASLEQQNYVVFE